MKKTREFRLIVSTPLLLRPVRLLVPLLTRNARKAIPGPIPSLRSFYRPWLGRRATKWSSRVIWERLASPKSTIVGTHISQWPVAVHVKANLHVPSMHARYPKVSARISCVDKMTLIMHLHALIPGEVLATVGASGAFGRVPSL